MLIGFFTHANRSLKIDDNTQTVESKIPIQGMAQQLLSGAMYAKCGSEEQTSITTDEELDTHIHQDESSHKINIKQSEVKKKPQLEVFF